ncbi:hypothetical protein [Orientia tsutsugamushi]|uniref:hypothetical protein n=1 Tax=Orientia tsutsugamushi TaxID=784 RepID=UPI0007E40180|nr:hypothetical protein [Orientia tsutsugamushi]
MQSKTVVLQHVATKKNVANLIEQLSLAKNILYAFTIIAEGAEIVLSLQQACIRLLSKLENDVE